MHFTPCNGNTFKSQLYFMEILEIMETQLVMRIRDGKLFVLFCNVQICHQCC